MSDRRAVLVAEYSGDIVAIRRALHADDPSVRSLALGSLARLGGLDSESLQAALCDGDRDVRCRGLELAIAEPVELVRLLDDEDDLVVETAAWALGERHQEKGNDREATDAVARLIAVATDHSESICRESAIAALGAIGASAGMVAILAGLAGDKATVRRRAVLALAPFSGPEVEQALERATHDRDRQVRQAAEDLREC